MSAVVQERAGGADYKQRFPVDYAGPNGHPTSLRSTQSYRHATPAEVSHEAQYYHTNAHGFASQSGHPRLDGRRAGISDDPSSRHSRESPAFDPQEQHDKEAKIAGCIAKGVDENGNRKIWNVRDAKEVFVNYKFVNGDGPGSRHALARFVLPTTESDIKDYKTAEEKKAEAEKEKKEKEEKERAEAEKNGGQGGNTNKQEDEMDTRDDTVGRGTKGEGDKEDQDEKHESEPKPRNEEEEEFIKHVIEEQEHLFRLKNYDGQSPAPTIENNLEMYIAEDDQFMPENWIPRSPALIRLAGKSPLNAEPPMSELFGAGMITPTRLHYVRSHGQVPRLTWETHLLDVFSDPPDILPNAKKFSMHELASMDSICLPVNIACDNNRRGEYNLIKKTKGFSWAAGATACAYWKGVPLRDVLIACGAPESPPSGKKWFVHYEGADNCSSGPYATSIPFIYAMDPMNDVMLAYEMNGRVLHPDHGYPLRSIIPGFVGGRLIKWLKKLWISEEESTNWYHIWENRVIPSFVTEQDSLLAKVFYHHPSTACYEQILNSAICRPAHGEQVALDQRKYKIQGYAYAGAGAEITRVEVSLDEGKTWKYCFRRWPDAPLRHGRKFWTWLHWYCEVKVEDLITAKEVRCRAWDSQKNTQPVHPTWNILGTLNNSIYVIKSTTVKDDNGIAVTWKHPVVPGSDDGWMKPSPEEQVKIAVEARTSGAADGDKQFTIEEVEKHAARNDCWIVINTKVYDVTSILSWHPGGANAIMPHAGKCHTETTLEYASIHDDYANKKRDECYIGVLTKKGVELMREDAKRATEARSKESKERDEYALKKHSWCPVTLVKRSELSHDTRRYTFSLPAGEGMKKKVGIPIGNHIVMGVHFRDRMVTRPYTPTRPVLASEDDGTFDLVVKSYFPDKEGKFPPGGTIGNYLDCLKEGEQIDAKGPMGEVVYLGSGKFTSDGEEHRFSKINLLAGGSGITPHYQLIHAIVLDDSDDTKLKLVYCNNSEDDILLFEELNDLAERSQGQFEIWHILSHPKDEEEWKKTGGTGHFDEGVMKERMFEPSDDSCVFVCGPPGLVEKSGKPSLEKWGFKDGKSMFGW